MVPLSFHFRQTYRRSRGARATLRTRAKFRSLCWKLIGSLTGTTEIGGTLNLLKEKAKAGKKVISCSKGAQMLTIRKHVEERDTVRRAWASKRRALQQQSQQGPNKEPNRAECQGSAALALQDQCS